MIRIKDKSHIIKRLQKVWIIFFIMLLIIPQHWVAAFMEEATGSGLLSTTNSAPIVIPSLGNTAIPLGQSSAIIDPGITISDADSANLNAANVILSDFPNGSNEILVPSQTALNIASSNGLSVSYNSATGLMRISGVASIDAYQAVLRNVTYLNTSSSPNKSDRTIRFEVTDSHSNTSEGTFKTIEWEINTPPSILKNETLTVDKFNSATITRDFLESTDTHSNPNQIIYNLGSVPVQGSLMRSGTVLQVNGTFSQEDINNNLITYKHYGNSFTDQFQFVVSDGELNTEEQTFYVSINNVNIPPTINAPSSISVMEDEVKALTGISFADIDAGVGTVVATFGVERGTLSATSGSGVTVSGSSNQVNLLGTITNINSFIANSNLMYTPDENDNGNVTLTITINDQGNIGSGGSKQADQSVQIQINPVNDAPVLTPSNPSLHPIRVDDTNNTGQSVASFIGSSITDVDVGAQKGIAVTSVTGNGTWEYSLDGGTTWMQIGMVSGNTSRLLRDTDFVRFLPSGNNAVAPTITYRAWDQTVGTAGGSADTTINGTTTAFSISSDTASINIVNRYEVMFEVDGGSAIPSQQVYHGETVIEPNLPTKENHIFRGWFIDSNFDTVFNFGTPITRNTSLYVKWDLIINSSISPIAASFDKNISNQEDINITISLNGNTLTSISNVGNALTNGVDYTISENVVTLKKEYLSSQDVGITTLTFMFSAGENQSLPITIIDTTPRLKYQIIYEGNNHNGGSVPVDNNRYAVGENVSVKGNTGNLVKSGYSFSGWNTKADGTGPTYSADDIFQIGNSNMTLFAKWNQLSSGGGGGVSTPITPNNNSITITPSQGGTAKNIGAEVTFPSDVFGGVFNVTIERVHNVKSEWQPYDKMIVSEIFEITKDKAGNFDKSVTVTLPFNPSHIDRSKYDVAVYWLDEMAGEWIKLDQIKVDWVSGRVSGKVNHFTKFTVLAVEKHSIYLTDIKGHWAEKSIMTLVNQGAITGYSEGVFKPNNYITRAEFTTILIKALDLETNRGYFFNDTNNHWARDTISTAYQKGMVKGFEDGSFKPDELITREQMASMIVNAFKLEVKQISRLFIDQEQVSNWANEVVATAVEHGIISGYQDGTLKPKNHTNRAEAVTMIVRALEKE